jgi:hypothetical protein
VKPSTAPVQTPINGPIPLNWRTFFSQLQIHLSHLPPAGEALADYADDTAAAAGGIALYDYYRTGSIVKQRVV